MAKKKDLAYFENLMEEGKELADDLLKLGKQTFNLGVQIIHLCGQLIPVIRSMIKKIKEFKAEL